MRDSIQYKDFLKKVNQLKKEKLRFKSTNPREIRKKKINIENELKMELNRNK